jgi:hypothetical protein
MSDEELLRHVDGELSSAAKRHADQHLRGCSSCQVQLERLKDDLATILEAQITVFEPSMPPPPRSWPRLESRLERAVPGRVPLWKRLLFLERKPVLRLAYGAAVLALSVAGISLWFPAAPVSAKEILSRAADADAKRLVITEHQVIRQRVRVKTSVSRSSSIYEAELESWKSVRSTYWKTTDDPETAGLLERYRANGLASMLPLSPVAAQGWFKVVGTEPSTNRSGGFVSVQAVSGVPGRTQGLEQVSLRVAPQNWRFEEMTLSFTDATYQITEEETSVVGSQEVPREAISFLGLDEAPGDGNTAGVGPQKPEGPRFSSADIDDLEIGVRSELHRIGADLGESIEVSPHPPEGVVVDVRHAPPEFRKRVMALLANKSGVQVEHQDDLKATNTGGRVTRTIQPAEASTPVDGRLIAFFGNGAAQENYTRSVLETTGTLLAHLYALENLANRWPATHEKDLSAAARTQLNAMTRDHAREISRGSLTLRANLEPLMKNFGYPASQDPTYAERPWQQASASGLEAAAAVDRALRSMLTTSDTPVSPDQALPQIQRGLHDLEQSARELNRGE